MELSLSPQTISVMSPVEISNVDRSYLEHRLQYQKAKQAKAFKLRRQLIKRRSLFHKRLARALSPQLLAELNIKIVLDTQYLQRPGFVGQFQDSGLTWTLNFQPHRFSGRWYFRAEGQSKLYSCSARHLETQLCYALGQYRSFTCLALRA